MNSFLLILKKMLPTVNINFSQSKVKSLQIFKTTACNQLNITEKSYKVVVGGSRRKKKNLTKS